MNKYFILDTMSSCKVTWRGELQMTRGEGKDLRPYLDGDQLVVKGWRKDIIETL